MYKKIFNLAIPNIISNITVPIVGMVDLLIVGMLSDDAALSGIALSTSIFNSIYYSFSFLRMGTSGLSAQSYGARDLRASNEILQRSLTLSLLFSLVILCFSSQLDALGLWFMEGSQAAESAASSYFKIRIWGAPANLLLFTLMGWFIGMQNSKTPMWISLLINGVNIFASYLFAITLGMGLDGVALGTVVAQYSGLAFAIYILLKHYSKILYILPLKVIVNCSKMLRFFRLGSDIFIRTMCLVAVFSYFTRASSIYGDDVLSANTILMQLFSFFSFFMDGFGYAAEALCGRYYGARNLRLLALTIRGVFRVGFFLALLFSLVYYFWGYSLMTFFTSSESVLLSVEYHVAYAAFIPLCSYGAFLWDGVFMGMTFTSALRNTMLLAMCVYFGLYFLFDSMWGSVGLWVSFLVFLGVRSVMQYVQYRVLLSGGLRGGNRLFYN